MTNPFTLRFRISALLCVVTMFVPQAVAAQTVVDPTTAEFDPSADHDRLFNGSPLVIRYDLEFYLDGAPQPFLTTSIGKPDPQPDGKIRVSLASVLGAFPAPGVVYLSIVGAVGPGGTARSAPSNLFTWSSPCQYSVSSSDTDVAATGGTGTVTITATAGCAWTAATTSSWVTITSGSSGSGNGSVAFSATANTASSPRTATLEVAGQLVTISQSGACNFSVSPTGLSLPASAGSASVGISTASGCSWTASENRSWLSIGGGAGGAGNGTVTVSATANPNSTPRSGTLTVAGQAIGVTQAGSCTYGVSPTSGVIQPGGGDVSVSVSAGAGCDWQASESSDWLSITRGASGSANGTVTLAAGPNTTSSERTANVTIAGEAVSVTQAAAEGPVAPSNLRITTSQN